MLGIVNCIRYQMMGKADEYTCYQGVPFSKPGCDNTYNQPFPSMEKQYYPVELGIFTYIEKIFNSETPAIFMYVII